MKTKQTADGHMQRSVRLNERQADINKISSIYNNENPQTKDGPLRTHGNSLGTESNRALILNRLKAGNNVEYIREEMSGLNSRAATGCGPVATPLAHPRPPRRGGGCFNSKGRFEQTHMLGQN